jgi:hypothetical protein
MESPEPRTTVSSCPPSIATRVIDVLMTAIVGVHGARC